MATRIRLRRVGRKREALYRIVVADQRSPRDGRFVETLGHYHPRTNPALIKVDVDKTRAWLARGAVPTDTVRSLLKRAGVFASAASTGPSAGE
jgi:small subunit ribosomal protein S16